MNAPITALYAALIGLLFVACVVQVVRNRRRAQVGLGTGSDKQLERAVRVHGNLAEYAPLVLLLMLIYELNDGAAWLLHLLGGLFVLFRLAHAAGLGASSGPSKGRLVGTAGSMGVIIVLALLDLWVGLG
jgi:hypothetical protein